MKFIGLLGFFLFYIALFLSAQEYIPMVKEGSVYNTTSVIIAFDPWDPDIYSTKSLGIYGDTVINTISYKKVYELDCIRDGVVLDPERYKGAIREDAEQQKVWFYTNDAEYLLYDFSLNVDDIFLYHSEFCGGDVQLQITGISTVEIDGTERREFELQPIDISGWAGSWIEGIGSTVHLYDYAYPHGNFAVYLSCYFENDELIYSPWSECCDGETGNSLTQYQDFSISPNPATNTVRLSFSDDKARLVRIYDVNNKLIDEFIMETSYFNYNLSNYKSGIYFIKISEGQNTTIKKFVVL